MMWVHKTQFYCFNVTQRKTFFHLQKSHYFKFNFILLGSVYTTPNVGRWLTVPTLSDTLNTGL
jgi:hypothetical protein